MGNCDSKPSDDATGIVVSSRGKRSKTFKMKRDTARAQKGLTLKANLQATLGGQIDMKQAVKLPPAENLNEWIAINTFLFYEIAINVYEECGDLCSEETCPVMSAGAKFTYLWADGKTIKKPIECSASEYMDFLFEWIYEQISDPNIFPQDDGSAFPRNFIKHVKTIFKKLFRMYAHLFHSHFKEIQDLGSEAHLNSSFKHLMLFILEFDLISKQEQEPLKNLIGKLE